MQAVCAFPVVETGTGRPCARHVPVIAPGRVEADQADGARHWAVPEEVPVAFVYNRRNHAVMLATPADLVDFAVGFSLTERIVSGLGDLEGLDILHTPRGIDLRFRISEAALTRFDLVQRRRNLTGTASCGLCGLDNADQLFEPLPVVAQTPVRPRAAALTRAIAQLGRQQPLKCETRSVHGAGWANWDGEIVMVREDVGRHTALDKLLGALARDNADMSEGFVVMSSRCSYELVEKAARCGVKALVSISAPTGLAIHKAQQAGLALFARDGDSVVQLDA